jgi:pimeloyl-ACP methyl ester carboxylesterase
MSRVVVFLPGIMGSELKLDKELIWPGSAASLIFPFKKMKELLDPNLVATDVIRSFSVSTQYQALVDDLFAWKFKENQDLFMCPYDWRKRNEDAAAVLAGRIDEAFAANGKDAEITIVAHSMGGLVARYYLESVLFNAHKGFPAVRSLITLATPHRGAPLALTAAMGMEKRLFLSADQVQQLANDPRYPALYQLMPSRHEPFAWDETSGQEFSPLDIYDDAIAIALGLAKENIAAAKAFRAVLDKGKPPDGVRYFYFGGTRQVTTAHVYVRPAATSKLRKIDVEDAGDGTVPVWSSGLGIGVQWQPVGGEHGTIYKNDDLRRTLARLLGYTGTLAAEDTQKVEVAVRDQVTEPEEPVHVALTFSGGVSKVQGRIRLERATITGAGKVTAYEPFGKPYPISYEGLNAEKLSVTFDAPDIRGIYKVLFESVAGEPLGADDLFVQEPG